MIVSSYENHQKACSQFQCIARMGKDGEYHFISEIDGQEVKYHSEENGHYKTNEPINWSPE